MHAYAWIWGSAYGLPRGTVEGSVRFMKIELTTRHERYINEKVKSGAYGSPDEVVREGLRLLEAGDERTRRIAWLQTEVEKGFVGPTTPWNLKDADRVRQLVDRRARRSVDSSRQERAIRVGLRA